MSPFLFNQSLMDFESNCINPMDLWFTPWLYALSYLIIPYCRVTVLSIICYIIIHYTLQHHTTLHYTISYYNTILDKIKYHNIMTCRILHVTTFLHMSVSVAEQSEIHTCTLVIFGQQLDSSVYNIIIFSYTSWVFHCVKQKRHNHQKQSEHLDSQLWPFISP